MAITNKTVLITGASSGLGHALAETLATGGNRLVVTARRVERLEALRARVQASGSQCVVCAADATDPKAVQAVLARADAAFGTIDIAILNAGGADVMSTCSATSAQTLHAMRVNYNTLVNFLCPLARTMAEHGGTIAYTSSPAGFFGLPKSGAYSAAKAAGRVLFDTFRIEYAQTPLRLVALYPGFTYTEGLDDSEVPIKALIISKERAVREMLRAIERGTAHAMFPKRISLLMRFARWMPEPVRRFVLSRVPN